MSVKNKRLVETVELRLCFISLRKCEKFAQSSYLQYPLIINLVEDGAIDLVGLQCHPVKYRHAELGFDWLLNFHGCST